MMPEPPTYNCGPDPSSKDFRAYAIPSVPRLDHCFPFHFARLSAVIPPAFANVPETKRPSGSTALGEKNSIDTISNGNPSWGSLTPPPTPRQVVPSHRPMALTVVPPS